MGQKTHPIGLRVGLWQRKWNNTWYTAQNEYSKLFFAHHRADMMLKNFFYSYSITKKMFANRALLVQSRFIKSNINLGFLFIFFYKLRAKRIRRGKRKKSKKLLRLIKKFRQKRSNRFKQKTLNKFKANTSKANTSKANTSKANTSKANTSKVNTVNKTNKFKTNTIKNV